MANFKIASYNCKHFSGHFKIEYITSIFDKCDFLLLQEHWLHEENFDVFSSLYKNGSVGIQGKSAMPSHVIANGRPHGGCIILWRSNICYNVSPIDTVSVRLNCVKVTINENYAILLFNVYMPCDDRSQYGNICEFQDILAEMSVIMHRENVDNVIIGGDFNTSFDRQSPQSAELKNFCNNEDIFPCCKHLKSRIKYTYECVHNGARTEIDHMLVSNCMKDCVNEYLTFDDVDNQSDHLVVYLELSISCDYLSLNSRKNQSKPNWYKATIHENFRISEMLTDRA